jgi:sugar lactone lactonase YvrE
LLFAVPALSRAAPPALPPLPTGDAPGTVHLFAGGVGDGGPAAKARLFTPGSIYVQPTSGDVYIADSGNDRVRRIDSQGVISTVAGSGVEGFSRDNQRATKTALNTPLGVVADSMGVIYIADTNNNKVLKVDGSGVLTTVAGTGTRGFGGDGRNAQKAMLNKPYAVALDPAGNVVIADSGNSRIRKVVNGVITTIAGSLPGYGGDRGAATRARLLVPTSLAYDRDGNLFVADLGNQRVRRVSTNGVITTVAGSGVKGYGGDGGSATRARFSYPTGVATDRFGNVFVSDFGNNRVRVINTAGVISTLAGVGKPGFSGDGGDSRRAMLFGPWSVAVKDDVLLVAEAVNNRVRAINSAYQISTIAGTNADGYSGDGGRATNARLFRPTAITPGPAGSVYVADLGDNRIRVVGSNGVISTIAGLKARASTGDGGPARKAHLASPTGVAIDRWGNVYIAENSTHRVRRIDYRGVITTVAGTGVPGYSGDRGPARKAKLSYPTSIAVDGSGNVYVADLGNSRIRKIDRRGIITTVAGTGRRGPGGVEGPATRAELNLPIGVAWGPDGALYIADAGNNRVKKVTRDGIIHVVAGNGEYGFSGDEGDAQLASLRAPHAVAVARDGTVYIADTLNQRIRKVTPSGTISTIAGEGVRDLVADEGLPSRLSVLTNPAGLCLLPDGTLLVSDTVANRILRLLPPLVP